MLDGMRSRAAAVVGLVLVGMSGCSPGSGVTSPDPEECERSLDEFEATRRQKTLDAREKVLQLEARLRRDQEVDEGMRAAILEIRRDMDAAVQQAGCE